MIKWLASVWNYLSSAARREKPYQIERAEELPDSLKRKTVYAIGEGRPWALALLCPCGCKSTIQLSLLADDNPSWQMQVDRKGRPTLSPSVWRTAGCRSHFLLREGRIIWCGQLNEVRRFK